MARPTIEDNTSTPEELNAALVDLGFEPAVKPEVKANEPDKGGEPSKEEKPDSEGKPGDKTSAEPEGKSATDPEPVIEKPQETPPGEELGADGKPKEKAKGGFQKKIETLTSRVETLRDKLEEKDGSEARLQRQLEEAKRELEDFRAGKTAEPEKKDDGPKRPKRPEVPDLSKLDYDTAKYEQAMKDYRVAEDKYDNDLDAYNGAVADKKAKDAVAAENKRREDAQREAQVTKVEGEAIDRLLGGKKAYEDWDDVYESLPEKAELPLDKSEVACGYIKYDSADPAGLYRFFFKDYLENDSAEGERIAKLSPARQVVELAKIEDRLAAERKGTKVADPVKPEPVVEDKKPTQEPPAKPKPPAKVPDEPIDTLGGGRAIAGTSLPSLYKQADAAALAGDGKEARRLLAQIEIEERKHAGKVA